MSGTDKLNAFLGMLEQGQDGPLLRYSIGLEYLNADDPQRAAEHLEKCLEQDPGYSAAYKALAQAQDGLGAAAACRSTLENGVAHAEERGDMQAKKEMEVFLKRLDKGKPLRNR
ncbi:tetratricopeptide repeat protein [Thiohalorhabdus sp. Cl-TMA]|uniref:Tetratricopeptide repeat protein n=1 Tax=Thiohalorhabdus methylotrophus TaxID=3242694 RepID=A0ABV4TVH1_9GAMM